MIIYLSIARKYKLCLSITVAVQICEYLFGKASCRPYILEGLEAYQQFYARLSKIACSLGDYAHSDLEIVLLCDLTRLLTSSSTSVTRWICKCVLRPHDPFDGHRHYIAIASSANFVPKSENFMPRLLMNPKVFRECLS